MATLLREQHGHVRVAIADHLKRLTGAAFQLTTEQLWGEGRNQLDPRWQRTPRELYQQLGDALLQMHPEALLRPLRSSLAEARAQGLAVVVTDVRTLPETLVIREFGGVLWRVHRREAQLAGQAALHSTELALDGFSPDRELPNHGTITDLQKHLEEALNEV